MTKKALENLLESDKLSTKLDGSTKNYIGLVYFMMGDYEKSIIYFSEALNLETFSKNYRRNLVIKNNKINNLNLGYFLRKINSKFQEI